MPFDGLTIGAEVHEVNAFAQGARIDKITQPETDEIVLFLRSNGCTKMLLLCSNPAFVRFHFCEQHKQSPASAPMFCMLLRKHLVGGRIESVEQPGNERIINIKISALNDFGEPEAKTLVLEIMGKYSNIILIDKDEKIIDSIRRVGFSMSRVRRIMPGLQYELPPSQNRLDPFTFSGELPQNARYVAEAFTGISRTSADEIIYRAQDGDVGAAFVEFIDNFRKKQFTPCLLLDENGTPIDYFAFPYKQFSQKQISACTTLSEALESFFFLRDRAQRIREQSRDLRQKLTSLLERCEHKNAVFIQKMNECDNMEKYRVFGELLLANLSSIKRGQKSVTLLNYYTGEDMVVPLDESCSPNANAQKYFKLYAKLKTALKLLKSQISENNNEADYFSEQLENLEKCESFEDLQEIRTELFKLGYIKTAPAKAKSQSKPLHFVSSSGIDILVGKNNTQNDRLTLSADADDLWLHTKDVRGSHVIVKSSEPDNKTVEEAATLAAYYSKARQSSQVAVDATKRRYVKKPSGAAPGKVIYTNNTTYFITPTQATVDAIKKL